MYSGLDKANYWIPASSGLVAQFLDFDSPGNSIVDLLVGLIN